MRTSSDVTKRLQAAIKQDGRSLYAIAKAGGLAYPMVYRIAHRERDGMAVDTMLRVAAAVGLEVEFRPVKSKRQGR